MLTLLASKKGRSRIVWEGDAGSAKEAIAKFKIEFKLEKGRSWDTERDGVLHVPLNQHGTP